MLTERVVIDQNLIGYTEKYTTLKYKKSINGQCTNATLLQYHD